MVFKNCTPFTDWISEINNTQLDDAKDIDVVMPMCNLIEYSYSKTSARLQQCCKNEPVLLYAGAIANFSALLKFKQKITGKTDDEKNGRIKSCWNNCAIKIFN